MEFGVSLGIEYQLHPATAVPQVDENHSAMVPPMPNPAKKPDFLPDVAFSQLTAIMRPLHEDNSQKSRILEWEL
jgi:hypothetical protein